MWSRSLGKFGEWGLGRKGEEGEKVTVGST